MNILAEFGIDFYDGFAMLKIKLDYIQSNSERLGNILCGALSCTGGGTSGLWRCTSTPRAIIDSNVGHTDKSHLTSVGQ